MDNFGYAKLFFALSGLALGIGIGFFWYKKTNIKKPKIEGQPRTYYTQGEIWMGFLKKETKDFIKEVKEHAKIRRV
jgi:hypothetical protein